jgi:hypothetical protein
MRKRPNLADLEVRGEADSVGVVVPETPREKAMPKTIYLHPAVLEPGPFSFRKEVANQAQNELKGFVPCGASLTRHAPMTQNPFMKTDSYDTTAPPAHRGVL